MADEQSYSISGLEDLEKLMNGADLPEPELEENPQEPQEQPQEPVEHEPAEPVEPVEPQEEYVPSFTYKVKDEEKQFDERLQSIIKTKEDEDYIRELYTKSDGLDSYKEKLDASTNKLTEMEATIADYQDKHGTTQAFYQQLVENRDSGNHRKLMESIGLGEDAVLKLAMDIAQEREMPAEQRQVVEANRKLEAQQEMMANQNTLVANQLAQYQNDLYAQQNELLAQKQTADINNLIASSHKDLNDKMSAVGVSFFDEVVATGKAIVASGAEAPTDLGSLVDTVAKKYGFMAQQNVAPANTVQQPATIPNVQGGNKTQMAKPVGGLEDLQKVYEQITSSNARY